MQEDSRKNMPPMRGKDRNRESCPSQGPGQGNGMAQGRQNAGCAQKADPKNGRRTGQKAGQKGGQLAKWFGNQPGETALDVFSSSTTDKLVSKGLRFASGLGQRILVHGVAMAAGISLATTHASGAFRTSELAFAIYMGIICLFPRGDARRSDWFMPVLTGLALAGVAMIFGVTWPFTLFFGGVTTWMMRVLCKKGRMGWEWAALPFLGLAYMGDTFPLSVPVWYLPTAVVAGYIGYQGVNRLVMTPMRRRIMARQGRRLEDMAAAEALPAPLQKPMLNLSAQAALASSRLERFDDNILPVLTALRIVNNRLATLLVMDAPRWDVEGERLITALGNVHEELVAYLTVGPLLPESEALAIEQEEEEEEDKGNAATQALVKQLKEIVRKKKNLPDHLQPGLDTLRTTTRGIMEAMERDTYLFTNGERFLSRYLPMVNKVVDRHISLSALSEKDSQEDHVAKTIVRCEEILVRMVDAFSKEQSRLLRNDTMDFNAELTALEALMRMDGK